MTYFIDLQAQSLTYVVTETYSGEKLNSTKSGFLLTFIGECNKTFLIQADLSTSLKALTSVGKL